MVRSEALCPLKHWFSCDCGNVLCNFPSVIIQCNWTHAILPITNKWKGESSWVLKISRTLRMVFAFASIVLLSRVASFVENQQPPKSATHETYKYAHQKTIVICLANSSLSSQSDSYFPGSMLWKFQQLQIIWLVNRKFQKHDVKILVLSDYWVLSIRMFQVLEVNNSQGINSFWECFHWHNWVSIFLGSMCKGRGLAAPRDLFGCTQGTANLQTHLKVSAFGSSVGPGSGLPSPRHFSFLDFDNWCE